MNKNYKISSPWPSGITINPGRGWELSELKLMAEALIYFEEPLQQAGINDDLICRRIWRDNPVLGKKSRSQAIAAVGAAVSVRDFVALIQPEYHNGKMYHFSLYEIETDTRNLDFVYPTLETAAHAIDCIQFTLSFIRACMLNKPLNRYASNFEGLRVFMTGKRTPEGASYGFRWNRSLRLRPV